MNAHIIVKNWGITDYEDMFINMRDFTDTRDENTPDQLWITQHYPVFTQGLTGKPENILMPSTIPVIQSDRGGQVTYHGPGQLVFYPLIHLKRRKIGVRQLVTLLENTTVEVLAQLRIHAYPKADAPGVYVDVNTPEGMFPIEAHKIASLGLKIRKGSSYHGIAINIDIDLTPFRFINPCGYVALKMTSLHSLGCHDSLSAFAQRYTAAFLAGLDAISLSST